MEFSFSPSINIVRDADKKIRYIPTANSKNVFQQISSNFKTGVHSFNIVGSYGTGKSAFLLALSKHLSSQENVFTPFTNEFNGCKKFEFINLIGQSKSLIEALADKLSVEHNEEAVLNHIKKQQTKLRKKDTCLVILIDEFGKFLEYAAKNAPDKELYFIQQLSEYANDSNRNILFITTLHQNFDAYAIGLTESQRKEWEKVKGRLKELTFNEPVEQLLNLAVEFIKSEDYGIVPSFNKKLLKIINETGVFNLLNNVSEDFAKSLYPFDLLSAMGLTLSLQRYGQNERSLFNFLQTDEFLGLNSFKELKGKNPYYNLACVYNYLQYNYYSVLTSKYNPDYFKWSMIRNSIDRADLELTSNIVEAKKIIKTIGLLDVLGSNAAKINRSLLLTYSKNCLGITNAKSVIELLENKKIIRYQSFKKRYKLFEGTDLDVESIHRKAKKEVSQINNLAEELKSYFNLSYVPAKSITYIKGTPRIFKYILSAEPIKQYDESNNQIDGFINLVLGTNLNKSSFNVKDEPIIYGYFKNAGDLADQLKDIKAANLALTEIVEDPIAKKELIELRGHLTDSLNDSINESLFSYESKVRWFYGGEELKIQNKKTFNQQLSKIAQDIYHSTPAFRNELMNKSKVSSSIHYAKKQYIEALINNWNKADLGLSGSGMPPEKTIFYTLLRNTGIHIDVNPILSEFTQPSKKSSFYKLWKASDKFIDSAKSGKRRLTEFTDVLSKKPFKLKEGFIEFWLITYLFIRREDFALFRDGVYVPLFSKELAVLLYKDANKFEIKAFDIQGVKLDLFNKYRELTQQESKEEITGSSFQATAKPFLVFYSSLSKYSQQTKSLTHDAIEFRRVIKNAKELEKTFFEDLPSCFGYGLDQLSNSKKNLDQFISQLNTAIKELRTVEEELIDRIELKILKILGIKKSSFKTYKSKIQSRYSTIKTHLLNPRQKTFHNRINSQLPDRKAWINSLVQALVGKLISNISDEEELIIYDRFSNAFGELDNLLELSQVEFDEEQEEAVKIEITGTNNDEVFRKNIILSKEQKRGSKALEKRFREVLLTSKDNQSAQAILIKLLKEISNGE